MQVDFTQVIIQLLVMMFIIIVGMVAKRFRILDEHGDKVISSLIVNITSYPYNLYNVYRVRSTNSYNIHNGNSYLDCTGICLVFSKLTKGSLDDSEVRVYKFATIFGNASF